MDQEPGLVVWRKVQNSGNDAPSAVKPPEREFCCDRELKDGRDAELMRVAKEFNTETQVISWPRPRFDGEFKSLLDFVCECLQRIDHVGRR